MRKLFAGENRRAAIMGVVAAPVIVALLVFRLFAGGDSAALPPLPVDPAPPTAAVPAAGVALPATSVPPPSPPVDPALLRDPFCPLAVAAAPGAAPVGCRPRIVPTGAQDIGLQDIFMEGDVRLARMNVGQFTFANLHVGDAVAGSFRVVTLSERCGDFEFAGSLFSLCEGEHVSK